MTRSCSTCSAIPELPDIVVYRECLERLLVGRRLERIRLLSPFVLRSVNPPPAEIEGRHVVGLRRLGKRIVVALEDELFLVIHLMIAGRLRWREPGAKPPGRISQAAFELATGSVVLTEASKKKRASLHIVRGETGLAAHDRGGLSVLESDESAFRSVLAGHRHTLKRALTDPRLFSGIGNAYSDEILHRARLSPFKLTTSLSDDEARQLWVAVRDVLTHWIERLRGEAGDTLPDKVTAFREGMAVHGRFGKPCPECESPVQRIVYTENEANYCARCQTGGKLLADRALSRLLRKDWPRTIDELE